MNLEMRELPAEWRWIQLKDVCKLDKQIIQPFTAEAKSLTYLSLEHIESETGRILKGPLGESEDSGNSIDTRTPAELLALIEAKGQEIAAALALLWATDRL